jgi:hypothetical protein
MGFGVKVLTELVGVDEVAVLRKEYLVIDWGDADGVLTCAKTIP